LVRPSSRSLVTVLLATLLVGALLAGCGSSSSSSSGGSSSGATDSSAKLPAATKAVTTCVHAIKSLPGLSSATRQRLETACGDSAKGDLKSTRKVIAEACREIIDASPIPDGAPKEHALAGCESASGK
jgi:entry exclusion lipoprotein TrbK